MWWKKAQSCFIHFDPDLIPTYLEGFPNDFLKFNPVPARDVNLKVVLSLELCRNNWRKRITFGANKENGILILQMPAAIVGLTMIQNVCSIEFLSIKILGFAFLWYCRDDYLLTKMHYDDALSSLATHKVEDRRELFHSTTYLKQRKLQSIIEHV